MVNALGAGQPQPAGSCSGPQPDPGSANTAPRDEVRQPTSGSDASGPNPVVPGSSRKAPARRVRARARKTATEDNPVTVGIEIDNQSLIPVPRHDATHFGPAAPTIQPKERVDVIQTAPLVLQVQPYVS